MATADDIDIAREQRARILAKQAGEADRYANEDDYLTLQERYDDLEGPHRGPNLPEPDLIPEQADALDWMTDGREDMSEFLSWAVDDHPWYRDQLAEQVERDADDSTVTWGEPASGEPRVTVVRPGQSRVTEASAARISNVEPGVSGFLPRVHEAVLDQLAAAVREFIYEHDLASSSPESIAARLTQAILDPRASDQAAAAVPEYVATLVRYALDEVSIEDLDEDERRWLTQLGTGRGPMNAGHEGLLWGPIALWKHLFDSPPVIRVDLDASAWKELTNRDTGARTLAALSMLSEALDVQLRLASPGHVRDLARRYRSWLRANCGLTPSDDRCLRPREESSQSDSQATAWTILQQWDDKDGHLRLLNALDDGARTVKALQRDRDVDLSEGGVDRYTGELETAGLVTVEVRTTESNRVERTSVGDTAAEMIAPDHSLVAPDQSTLDEVSANLTPTPHPAVSTVECAREGRDPPRPSDPEAWLAATGDAREDGYAQWLSGQTIDSWRLHDRFTTVAGRGVTLVDEPVREQEDGRVCYMSHLDDELLANVQWGGPLATLGRLMGVLLEPRLLSKALDPDRVGSEFQQLHDGAILQLQEKVENVIRWGHQVGWFSEDEQQWDNWFDRFTGLRATLLEELGEAISTDDYDRRGELMKDLHGIICSATHLYFAAGVKVTINLRFPNSANMIADDKRFGDFLTFMQKTATKQTVYKYHSGYRMTLEDRAEKLKKRLPYSDDLDPQEPYMETTADWLITGPSVTEYQSQIERALAAEDDEVREAIQEGDEDAAQMVLPVTDGNAYGFISNLFDDLVTQKGYTVDGESRRGHDRERLLRLLYRALNTADQPHRINPFDVVDALRSIAQSSKAYDPLRIDDLEYGLSQLPPERLWPELTRSTTKMLQVMLRADDPIGRSEIIERAGISGSTYDRQIDTLATLDVVEAVHVNGHRKWVGTLEPWWCDGASGVSVDGVDAREGRSDLPQSPMERDLLAELIYALDLDVDDQLLSWPPELEALYREARELRQYRGFIWASLVDFDDLVDRADPPRAVSVVEIGEPPVSVMPDQDSLSTVIASSPATAEDHGQNRPTAAVKGRSKVATTVSESPSSLD